MKENNNNDLTFSNSSEETLNFSIRMPEPSTFSGRKNTSSRPWITQLERYFTVTRAPEHIKIPYAVALLRDDAAVWWEFRITRNTPYEKWEEFKNELICHFSPVNTEKQARDKLAISRQTRSAQEYSNEFRKIVLQIPNITEDELIDKYIRGLKPQTRGELEYREPPTFNDAVKIAVRYEATHFNNNFSRIKPPIMRRTPTIYRMPTEQHDGATPVELDKMKSKKLIDFPRYKRGRCVRCHEIERIED
ncbi:uncharacterized protein VTP21DRAFT_10830 [Calcarisporiella thermophila]|uniref:uncharacterized protein n=1 Tax=Calcarisporiella thermophila TaxID=911321 RepID=UPI0037427F03